MFQILVCQPLFAFSKLTIETLEQDLKYVQSYQWRNQNDAIGSRSVAYIVNFKYFTPCSNVSVVNFEHVIVG